MIDRVPSEIAEQVSQACALIETHLAPTLRAIHLYGSAVDGGLKPHSDVDLLVTVSQRLDDSLRQALLLDLLTVSVPPGEDPTKRPLEVTVVVYDEVVPWRYPARREMQFGEWLRKDILAGVFEPGLMDFDLAVLLTKARQHSVAIAGPPVAMFFEAIPENDFRLALADTLKQWNTPADWAGDERNIVLTLARIWYSVGTGRIAPKDVAASWLMERLPVEYHSILYEAQQAYLGKGEDNLGQRADETAEFILFVKAEINSLL